MNFKVLSLTLGIFFCTEIVFSQAIYQNITSEIMSQERPIKILLPRNYEKNDPKEYPVLIVLDGDYLFEPVGGLVDYYSYWEEMPEAIVVGISQNTTRSKDLSINPESFLLENEGLDFFEFIGLELIPWLDKNYRTASFLGIVGHDLSANFANYYLLKDKPLFDAYINLSPEYAPIMFDNLPANIKKVSKQLFYYTATSDGDIKQLKEETTKMHAKLDSISMPHFHYSHSHLGDASHYGLAVEALPIALKNIFAIFRPISKEEYQEKLSVMDEGYVKYIEEKYTNIKNLYGLNNPMRLNDIRAVEAAIKKNEKWEELQDLAKIVLKQYPDTTLGNYYMGNYYEMIGKPTRAKKEYQAAFVKEPVMGIDKDRLLDLIDAIKADGY
ncbi:MAG: alpha/beta hydrolase-fold protein [Flavobacteriaceae bacterium]|nr:alpha/beta hydrolase-fold protein [Flavobacteriaceae bacterium]